MSTLELPIVSLVWPLTIALLLIIFVGLGGVLIAKVAQRKRFAGFEDIAADAEKIATYLEGDIFRDGSDLVVAGNCDALPTVARFSHTPSAPGLNLRMSAPATFALWAAGAEAEVIEGRVRLRTTDPVFDAILNMRTDHPAQAKMFLGHEQVPACLRQLCCSSAISLAITPGAIELSEPTIPQPFTGNHVVEHVEAMAVLAEAFSGMPGADALPIKPLRREHKVLRTSLMICGVALLVLLGVAASRVWQVSKAEQRSGMLIRDAALIPGANTWRVAVRDDFEPTALAWMDSEKQPATGRITGDFSGNEDVRDAAYVLARPDGTRRVTLLAGGANRYDATFTHLAIV
ncbi:MAG TPA: hypothetical protein VE994_04115, partial [Terriglobales bacterium]|nr:hypothetical protein [Terriglobales bacterium]